MSASTPSTTPEDRVFSPALLIDHTLHHPLIGAKDIRRLCGEAHYFGFAAVCIPPLYFLLAAELLATAG